MTDSVSLREHFEAILSEMDRRYEQRFDAQEKANTTALTAAEKAVLKAEVAAEARFASVNEFRGTLSDQTATLMPRVEAEARMQAMADKLGELGDRVNRAEGRGSGYTASWAVGVAVMGLLLGVGSFVYAVTR